MLLLLLFLVHGVVVSGLILSLSWLLLERSEVGSAGGVLIV